MTTIKCLMFAVLNSSKYIFNIYIFNRKKGIHTGLKQLEGGQIMTDFSFLELH